MRCLACSEWPIPNVVIWEMTKKSQALNWPLLYYLWYYFWYYFFFVIIHCTWLLPWWPLPPLPPMLLLPSPPLPPLPQCPSCSGPCPRHRRGHRHCRRHCPCCCRPCSHPHPVPFALATLAALTLVALVALITLIALIALVDLVALITLTALAALARAVVALAPLALVPLALCHHPIIHVNCDHMWLHLWWSQQNNYSSIFFLGRSVHTHAFFGTHLWWPVWLPSTISKHNQEKHPFLSSTHPFPPKIL